MSADPRTERLMQAYLDGVATPSEAAELAELLVREPTAAVAFARAVRFEALLHTHLTEEKQAREWMLPTGVGEQGAEPEQVVELPERRRRRPAIFAAWATAILTTAAMLLIAVRLWNGEPRVPAVVHRVVAGRVSVDGVEATSFADGSRLEVLGSSSAAIHLADGNDFELTPAASAVIRREGGESIVKLDYGNGKFRGLAAKRPLRVDTPLGAVSGRAADFAVDLLPTEAVERAKVDESAAEVESTEPPAFEATLPGFLIVAVLAGQVEVQEADQKVKVSAGESRAFSQEKVPAIAGKVVEVSDDGKWITIEAKRGKPGVPPPRRGVAITRETKLIYFGAALGDDRPTVGAWVLATLDASSPDSAATIEFGNRSPTFSGTVREVSADGRSLMIEVYRKGDKPLDRTITLDDRTRTSFSGFTSNDIQATLGYQAWVWLAGESDLAAEVRFLFKTKGPAVKTAGDDVKDPPTKKPGSKQDPKSESKPEGKADRKKDGKPTAKPDDKTKPDDESPKSNEKPKKPNLKFDVKPKKPDTKTEKKSLAAD